MKIYRKGMRTMGAVLVVVSFFAALSMAAVHSHASKTDLTPAAQRAAQKDTALVLTRGMADVVNVSGNIADVMVANPEVIDVMAIQSNRLYIVGASLGSTNIITLDERGDVIGRLNVHVKIDDGPVKALISKMYPEESVDINSLEGQVVVSGTVSTPEVANKIVHMVSSYIGEITDLEGVPDEVITNMLNVRGEQQVMLRVRIVEQSRNILREIGAETTVEDFGVGSEFSPGPLGAMFSVLNSGASSPPLAAFSAATDLGAFGPISTTLSALEEDGLAKVLAEPNLTSISGETAGFLAGGEFPVPSGRDSEGNLIIEFRQFGVSLNFRPVVMSAERISLQLDTEVSSISRDSQVTLSGVQVPGLDVRRASTTVEMGSGGTLMIAGLLQSQALKNMSDYPGIKNIPILSDLMSSEGFRREETEMVVLVSPYLVRPFADRKQAKYVPEEARAATQALAGNEMPVAPHGRPLKDAFANNITRTYKKLSLSDMFSDNAQYGYILD